MPFAHLAGNPLVKQHLQHMLDCQRVGHAFLFSGPKGVGKRCFAEALARRLVCPGDTRQHHPDIRLFAPSGKTGMHSIDTMRQFSDDVALSPFQAERKVFILDDVDRMLPTASNALLKTFEEPSLDTVIILVSSHPEYILETILSRCRQVHFRRIPEGEIAEQLIKEFELDGNTAQETARLAQGSMGKAFRLARDGQPPERQLLLDALAQGGFHSWDEVQHAASSIAKGMEEAKKGWEESARETIPKDLPALHRHAMEKEIEGLVALQYLQQVDALFADLLGWFRDLHLLGHGGNKQLLWHSDQETCLRECRSEALPSLRYVQRILADARLAVARFTPLNTCLEDIFLKLRFVS